MSTTCTLGRADLLPRLEQAVATVQAEIDRQVAQIRAVYAAKPVRYGFLWRKARPPTEAEVEARLRESREIFGNHYDHAWAAVDGGRSTLDKLQELLQAVSDEKTLLVNLSPEDYVRVIRYTTP